MKTFKVLPIAAFCLTAAMLLSSCGIMKNNDFSSQKYTNFKKGEAAINYKADNVKKEVATVTAVSSKEEISEISITAASKPTQSILNSMPKNKIESSSFTTSNNNTKELKKVRINRTTSFIMNHIAKKANTESVSGGDANLLLLVILAILLPPLSVFLARGLGTEFWIDLILTLLFWLPGMIYALLIAFDAI